MVYNIVYFLICIKIYKIIIKNLKFAFKIYLLEIKYYLF